MVARRYSSALIVLSKLESFVISNARTSGEPREFANKLLDDWLQHRSRKMNRPHMRMHESSCITSVPHLGLVSATNDLPSTRHRLRASGASPPWCR